MKSAPAIMQTRLARATFLSVPSSPVARIALTLRLAAGGAKFRHFVVKRLPVAGQHVAAGDDDVDLLRTRRDAFADLLHAQVVGGESPAGNPVETAATGMPEPSSASTAAGTISW